MSDPISYSFATPCLGLPLLFSGQSQKEVTVNEALSKIDMLLAGAVNGTLASPPASPVIGESWIVGSGPTGAFAGRTDQIAGWSDGGWRFIPPSTGLRIYDREAAAIRVFSGGWSEIVAPASPAGGAIIDVEARSCLTALLGALIDTGIISAA
ncbi:hypothetical protein GGQ88_003692 [Novosphingobium hassiacum]|uniref:DUF2793 domain-containing protein n=1 Tax=Novosphingobium hassiacum TaxID=173676 RepID=A0A7W6A0R7_9SPHN|nr:DUF2793 domain-containing protein [Novosphingobium hassiacum]MBB3862392.1 hypothetical protein [Novosphingobium hassiacum]